MKTTIEKNQEVTIVTLDGSLDTVSSTEFLSSINDLLTEPEPNIIVDCENLIYISSSGLRAFKMIQKSVNDNKGKAVVRKLRPEVYKIFELTGFTKIMTVEK